MTNSQQAERRRRRRAEAVFRHGRLSYTCRFRRSTSAPSAPFYESVFDWKSRGDGINHLSFTDATGDMIGAWVTGRAISREPGVLPYIDVHGIDAALEQVRRAAAQSSSPPYPEGDLWVATFSDPAGNVLGCGSGPRRRMSRAAIERILLRQRRADDTCAFGEEPFSSVR